MKRLGIILLFCQLLFLISCDERREILDSAPKGARVKVVFDWVHYAEETLDKTTVPNGASIYFYPLDGESKEPITLLTNHVEDQLDFLPVGRYNVIAFNDTEQSHDYIRFKDSNDFDTFEAYWEQSLLKKEYQRNQQDSMVVFTEDILLVERVEEFEIKADLGTADTTYILNLVPKMANRKTKVIAHIKGLDNLARSGSMLYLNNMALGHDMWEAKGTAEPVMHVTTLSSKHFFESDTLQDVVFGAYPDGYIEVDFYTFGPFDAVGSQDLTLSFMLKDGTRHTDVIYDVAKQMTPEGDIIIEVGLGKDEDDQAVELPNVSGDGGFDVEVEDWEDEIIDIPLSIN